jgi:hypothetical protein
MRIRFSNDYVTDGGRHYKAGTVADITDGGLARSLILRGKAVAAPDPAAKEPDSAAAETKKTPPRDKGKD